MPRIKFSDLPDHARLWVFAASRELAPDEARDLLAGVDGFLDQWRAHGVPLTSARDFRYDRFVLVGVDEQAAGVSGCSIDALLRGLKQFEAKLQLSLIDHSAVLFRADDSIDRTSREEFANLASRGEVGPATLVFDNTVQTVGDVRSGRWELPARDSWHAKAFF